MEMTVKIPFADLLNVIHKLTPAQRAKLQSELFNVKVADKARLREMLLNGPAISDEQLETFKQNRKEINRWLTTF